MTTAFYVPGQGGQTVTYCDRLVLEYPHMFSKTALAQVVGQNVGGTLISFGDMDSSSNFDKAKVVASFSKTIKKVTSSQYLSGKPLFRDSGGFQIQTGTIGKASIPLLLQANMELLIKHAGQTCSFTLDIVPPMEDCPFTSYQEILDLNRTSLDKTLLLGRNILKDVYAIHQFKSPALHGIFHALYFREGRAKAFSNWAVGGMASQSEAFSTEYVPWVLPLIEIVKAMKDFGRTNMSFHILGNAAFEDDISKVLFAMLIEDLHGINVNITWDTNTVYNGFTKDHLLYYADPGTRTIHKMPLFETDLTRPDIGMVQTPTSVRFYQVANQVFGPASKKPLTVKDTPLYEDEKPTLFFYVAGVILFFNAHNLSAKWAVEDAADLYPLWKHGDTEAFVRGLKKSISRAGGTHLEKRAMQTFKSLGMLAKLDVAAIKTFILKDMRKNEFPCLLR